MYVTCVVALNKLQKTVLFLLVIPAKIPIFDPIPGPDWYESFKKYLVAVPAWYEK
jgi:hypothetical protein